MKGESGGLYKDNQYIGTGEWTATMVGRKGSVVEVEEFDAVLGIDHRLRIHLSKEGCIRDVFVWNFQTNKWLSVDAFTADAGKNRTARKNREEVDVPQVIYNMADELAMDLWHRGLASRLAKKAAAKRVAVKKWGPEPKKSETAVAR